MSRTRILLAISSATAALAVAGAANAACVGSGVITRITGQPQDVVITRTENGASRTVSRPRILEVICVGDVIRVNGATTVQMSVDGRGQVRVASNAPFTVPARSAGRATMAGNAYRQISEAVLPDMRRQAWDVRLRGEEETFGFALPGLAQNTQQITPGARDLLVRLTGGAAPYTVELLDGSGRVLGTGTGQEPSVTIRGANLAIGQYRLRARSGSSTAEAGFAVAAAAVPLPDMSEIEDAEARAASVAAYLAEAEPAYALEAEQILAAAPANGLDRERVYELIEGYGAVD